MAAISHTFLNAAQGGDELKSQFYENTVLFKSNYRKTCNISRT